MNVLDQFNSASIQARLPAQDLAGRIHFIQKPAEEHRTEMAGADRLVVGDGGGEPSNSLVT